MKYRMLFELSFDINYVFYVLRSKKREDKNSALCVGKMYTNHRKWVSLQLQRNDLKLLLIDYPSFTITFEILILSNQTFIII